MVKLWHFSIIQRGFELHKRYEPWSSPIVYNMCLVHAYYIVILIKGTSIKRTGCLTNALPLYLDIINENKYPKHQYIYPFTCITITAQQILL